MSGVSGARALRASRISRPLARGIWTSPTTRSKVERPISSSASWPSATAVTSCPAARKTVVRSSSVRSSSSAMRIRARATIPSHIMEAEMKPRTVPSIWPVFAALLVVALLFLAMLGTDLVVARGVAARTAEIVENAQRSIELVDDLRAQAHRLVVPGLADVDVAAISERITVDSAAYPRLATSPGEREEWNNLRGLLGDLRAAAAAGRPTADLASDIEASIDALVRINGKSADESVDAIHRIHEDAILADTLVGGLAFALA